MSMFCSGVPVRLKLLILSPFFTLGLLFAQSNVQDKPLPISQPRPSAQTIRSWHAHKFGMFIHFGLYSQFGGVYHGKPVEHGYSEQIMAFGPIPVAEYAAAAASFNPVAWDPDAVVALARAAGMEYIVLTAKHHDGFNMFATKQTKFNVVDATPYHRDVVKELADACRRGGIAFGVYYSTIDWHEPGMDKYIAGNDNDLSDAHARFNAAQLRELMTNYGPLSEIWFDMGRPTPAQSELFATTVHSLQPQTMVSGRVWNEQGDFVVMGDNQMPAYGLEQPWETPASIFNDTWGYRSWQKRDDVEGKIHEHLLHLVQVVSRGGNYILNIGPEGDGSIVPYEADVLRGMGSYLKVNGEAIYGTESSPLAESAATYVTTKGRNVYVFVNGPHASVTLPHTARTQWRRATLLHGGLPVKTHVEGEDTVIDLPESASAEFLPVVKLETASGLIVRPAILPAGPDGAIALTTDNAETFYNYNGRGYYDPKTLYKLRWYVPSGCHSLRFHGDSPSSVAVVSDGLVQTIQAGEGAIAEVRIGADHRLELTPPEPFVKGTALPSSLKSVDLQPCTAVAK
jgi:alpha-L-fucosidase